MEANTQTAPRRGRPPASVPAASDRDGEPRKADPKALPGSFASIEIPEHFARCRVMKKGADRIATGEYKWPSQPTERFPTYAQGDVCMLDPDTAVKYEDDGWVEILS